jgi:hypothetical protein
MECLGAEVTNEHHNNMFTHLFYVRDDRTVSEGLNVIQHANDEAIANVQRKVDATNDADDAERKSRAAPSPKRGIMQQTSSVGLVRGLSFDGMAQRKPHKLMKSSSAREPEDFKAQSPTSNRGEIRGFSSHRSMLPRRRRGSEGTKGLINRQSSNGNTGPTSNKELLLRRQCSKGKGVAQIQPDDANVGIFYQGTFAEELDAAVRDEGAQGRSRAAIQQADELMVGSADEFDREAFVDLRKRSLVVSLEEVCGRFGVQAKVTLRVVSRRYLKEEPDSAARTDALSNIVAGKSVHEFARKARGRLKNILSSSNRKRSSKPQEDDNNALLGIIKSESESSSSGTTTSAAEDENGVVLPRPAEVDVVTQGQVHMRHDSGTESGTRGADGAAAGGGGGGGATAVDVNVDMDAQVDTTKSD